MRVIDAAVQTAINNANGIKINARLSIYNNRAFFEFANLNVAHVMPGAQSAGIFEDISIFQDCRFDSTQNKVVTVSKVTGGYQLAMEGLSPTSTITNSCATETRPTVIPPYVFYQNTDGSLAKDTYAYNNSVFTVTGTEVISSATNKPGSFYGLDSTNAIHVYIDDGGVGITHYHYDGVSAWVANTYSGRIMFPNDVWASSKAVRLNFAATAKTDDGIFVYLSSPNGEVIGIQILPNGNASDIFVAFPQDLSKFYISNCVVGADQRIHLCGQFVRTDNWNSGSVYNLSLWSDDGITFSIDRFTLCSTLGYRFMLSLGRSKVIFSDMNRIVELDPCYAYYKENSTSLEITGNINISGTAINGWDVAVGNGSAQYTGHPLVVIGNIAKFEVGIQSNGSIVWSQYDNTIISKIDEVFSNGSRSLSLNIVSEGLWRASAATYPFGMEIQSKQSIRDDVSAMDNLSVAPNVHGVKDPLCVALSNVEAPFGVQGKPDVGLPTDYYSGDLISAFKLEEYPEITSFPLTIKLFGWSRIGLYDTNPNTADNTSASLLNDTFTPLFIVEGTDGTERTVIIPTADAVGGINYPPQTWKTGNSRATTGTYPVVFSSGSSSGLQIGDKVKEVGIRVFSEAPTVYCLERIEIPELPMYMIGTAYGGTLGEDYTWTEVYTPPVVDPLDFPPIVFPPIVFPPEVFPPVNPPAVPSCGTGPVDPILLIRNRITMLATNANGQSYTIPYQCRLRANTNPNPSKLNILGDYDEGYAIPYSPAYWWVNTTRNDWYRVEALNKDQVVVATANFSVTGDPIMIKEWEKRTGVFNNTTEVDICYLRFVVDKCVNDGGGFTVTSDPYSAAATPFRPTSVGHANGSLNFIGIKNGGVWVKRGILTWGQTPGGIWIKDVNKESVMGWGNDISGWRPCMKDQWEMKGGASSQYSTSKVLEITVKQKKRPANGGSYLNFNYSDNDHPNPTNSYGQGGTGIAWRNYSWGMGYWNPVLLMYERNDNQEFSGISSVNGNGCESSRYLLARSLILGHSGTEYPRLYYDTCHLIDDEVYIKVKFPGYEHPGHTDAPTKLTIIFASIENVCLA